MTLSSVPLRPTLRIPSSRRFMSSKSPKSNAKQRLSLPPAKLRALISLYHQTETFVTREKLSERIDDAFVHSHFSAVSGMKYTLQSRFEMQSVADRVQSLPQIGDPNTDERYTMRSLNPGLYRSLEVRNALYGTDGDAVPGLDALLDEEDSIRRLIQQEKNASCHSSDATDT